MIWVTIRTEGDDLVDVHRGRDIDDDADLRRAAAALSGIDHHGVARFVRFDDRQGDRPAELVTVHVGRETWADLPPRSLRSIADGTAALARTLDELHARGLVHGSVTPDQVLVTAAGPILTGFGSAHRLGEAVSTALADPAHPPGSAATAAIDVHGIGATLGSLLERTGATGRGAVRLRRDLHRLAERATDPEVRRRPSISELIALGAAPDDRPEERSGRGTVRTAAGAAGALVLGVVGIAALSGRVGGSAGHDVPSPVPEMVAVAATPTTNDPPPPPPTRPAPPPTPRPAPKPTTTSPSPSTDEAALVVDLGGTSFRVGRTDDAVLVDDWGCAGTAVVLVSAATGEVHVFDGAPDESGAIAGRLVASVPPSQAVATAADGGCARLMAGERLLWDGRR